MTLTRWNFASFSLRRNVSGIQTSTPWSRIDFILVTVSSNARRGSFHCCRRYMLTE